MTIDHHTFRHAMGQFASGVTVVTTHDNQTLIGITVSSFASLSLEPALVLVCIDNRGRSHDALAQTSTFAVNILAEDQERIARVFASRTEDKFATVNYWLSPNQLPLLDGVVATVECRTINALPGGDHTIFIGEVIDIQTYDRRPLVYHATTFGQFTQHEPLEAPVVAPILTMEVALS